MTNIYATPAPEVPDDVSALTKPTFTSLQGLRPELCDRHVYVAAVVKITLATGRELVMCGNCARKNFGYEHTVHAVRENKQKGSDH